MKAQVGQYRFGSPGVGKRMLLYTAVNESGTCAKFVKDSFTYEDAVKEVYRLNGWGEPKKLYRKF